MGIGKLRGVIFQVLLFHERDTRDNFGNMQLSAIAMSPAAPRARCDVCFVGSSPFIHIYCDFGMVVRDCGVPTPCQKG